MDAARFEAGREFCFLDASTLFTKTSRQNRSVLGGRIFHTILEQCTSASDNEACGCRAPRPDWLNVFEGGDANMHHLRRGITHGRMFGLLVGSVGPPPLNASPHSQYHEITSHPNPVLALSCTSKTSLSAVTCTGFLCYGDHETTVLS